MDLMVTRQHNNQEKNIVLHTAYTVVFCLIMYMFFSCTVTLRVFHVFVIVTTTNDSRDGLSAGAIVGIVFAIILFIAILVTIIVYIYRRHTEDHQSGECYSYIFS